jgi:hypothetical protein
MNLYVYPGAFFMGKIGVKSCKVTFLHNLRGHLPSLATIP